MPRRTRLLLLLTAVTFWASACGGSSDDGSLQPALRDVDEPAASATPPAEPRPTAPASTPTRTPSAAPQVDTVDDRDCPADAPDFAEEALTDVRFGEDLTCASFAGALLDGVSFAATSLNGADFRNATLLDVEFDSVTTRGADFTGAALDGVAFEEVDLSGALFAEALVSNTAFEASICPNGVASDDNSDTCADILRAED